MVTIAFGSGGPLTAAEVGAAAVQHVSNHATGGSDPLAPSAIGAAVKATVFSATLYAANWGVDCLNLSDEVWEQGMLSTSTGAESSSSTYIRTPYANKIPVTAGNHYFLSTNVNAVVLWYDASDAYLSYGSYNMDITAPATAAYGRLRVYASTGIAPETAPKVMFSLGATALSWEPQGRGYHLKATDYTQIAAITSLTDVDVRNPSAALMTEEQYDAAGEAKILFAFQTAATEIVLVALSDPPTIDIPVTIKLGGDVY